jgi:hypothetical protein
LSVYYFRAPLLYQVLIFLVTAMIRLLILLQVTSSIGSHSRYDLHVLVLKYSNKLPLNRIHLVSLIGFFYFDCPVFIEGFLLMFTLSGSTRHLFSEEYCRRDWEEAQLLRINLHDWSSGQDPLKLMGSVFENFQVCYITHQYLCSVM